VGPIFCKSISSIRIHYIKKINSAFANSYGQGGVGVAEGHIFHISMIHQILQIKIHSVLKKSLKFTLVWIPN